MKGYNYGCKFIYRETKNGEHKTEYIFFMSNDSDITNACEIAMLRFIKSHNYYSGKVVKTMAM